MSMSYDEMSAAVRIDNIITLIKNMNSKKGKDAAHPLDEFIIKELEEVKRLLKLA